MGLPGSPPPEKWKGVTCALWIGSEEMPVGLAPPVCLLEDEAHEGTASDSTRCQSPGP